MAGKEKRVKYEDFEERVLKWGGGKRFRINGKMKELRGHSLTKDRRRFILDEWHRTRRFASPYSVGPRSDCLIALSELGLNQAWSELEVKLKLKEVMSRRVYADGQNGWDRFEKKPSRGKKPHFLEDRIYDNFKSFRRLCKNRGLHPYGKRLSQLRCSVDIFIVRKLVGQQEHVERFLRLNTYSGSPLLVEVGDRSEIPEVDRGRLTFGPVEASG
jgi:hypothetical protein